MKETEKTGRRYQIRNAHHTDNVRQHCLKSDNKQSSRVKGMQVILGDVNIFAYFKYKGSRGASSDYMPGSLTCIKLLVALFGSNCSDFIVASCKPSAGKALARLIGH